MDSQHHNKFANTVLFLLKGCGDRSTSLTKLLKMLYFSDFRHYKRELRPITGISYVAAERGPVPDGYEGLLHTLIHGGILKKTLVEVQGRSKKMQEFWPLRYADDRVFSESEVDVLEGVLADFRDKPGKYLSDASHKEGPWTWAWDPQNQRKPVPYTLATWLDNLGDEVDGAAAQRQLERKDVQAELDELRKRDDEAATG